MGRFTFTLARGFLGSLAWLSMRDILCTAIDLNMSIQFPYVNCFLHSEIKIKFGIKVQDTVLELGCRDATTELIPGKMIISIIGSMGSKAGKGATMLSSPLKVKGQLCSLPPPHHFPFHLHGCLSTWISAISRIIFLGSKAVLGSVRRTCICW